MQEHDSFFFRHGSDPCPSRRIGHGYAVSNLLFLAYQLPTDLLEALSCQLRQEYPYLQELP